MHVVNRIKLLGMSIIVCGISFTCPAKDKIESFAAKLKKLSIKPSVALSFANKKIRINGTAKPEVNPLKGEPVFVTGPYTENALVITDQSIGITCFEIRGEDNIFSTTEGSFSCFFTPMIEFQENKWRHFFFSVRTSDYDAYFFIIGNSRLILQFREGLGAKRTWKTYQFDFKWSKRISKKFKTGAWYHIAATWNSDYVTLFINGIPCSKTAVMHKIVADTKNVTLGTYNGKECLNSAISDLAFFDRCLTASDVKTLSKH